MLSVLERPSVVIEHENMRTLKCMHLFFASANSLITAVSLNCERVNSIRKMEGREVGHSAQFPEIKTSELLGRLNVFRSKMITFFVFLLNETQLTIQLQQTRLLGCIFRTFPCRIKSRCEIYIKIKEL